MKVYHKALTAGLCVALALSMTGCGDKVLDGSQTVATVGEKTMTLGEANFLLRYQQVQIESYYESMLGEGIYDMDLYGDGTSLGENMKNDIMTQMQEYYILEEKAADYGVELTEDDKAAITEAAEGFLAANAEDVQAQMTADQATIEKVLTLMTVGTRTANAVAASAEVNVTDEEAAQRGFSFISVSKGSGDDALTEEELQENRTKLEAVAAGVDAGSTFDTLAEGQELTVNTGSYSSDNTGAYAEEMIAALDGLAEGQVSGVIETDTNLYLVQLTAEFDEEATASRKQTLIANAQSEFYDATMDGWKEEYPMTVETSVWDEVVFDRSYDLAQ